MTKENFLNSIEKYEKIGLKCGIEIHQQLNTSKLFCSCPSIIESNQNLNKQIIRKLRFSLSESGKIDDAILNEFKKDKTQIYKYSNKSSCLVELDEMPPLPANEEAIKTAIRVSQMLNLTFFDKIIFMRKMIIDGSITTGFQRTAILGFGGFININSKRIGINAVNIEEDSCRTIKREDKVTIFALDRQSIPLIEITTSPDIKTPNQAFEVAKFLGDILRSFSSIKRGLGTIRQDLNVSIRGGSRIEIKGAQNLKLIPKIIENEINRQKNHIAIIQEIKKRKIDKKNFSDFKIYNITKIFINTTSKIIKENLNLENSDVFAIKLNNFKDILKMNLQENFRFATEISIRNKQYFPQIKGLFHLDELPLYGIIEKEIEDIKKFLNFNKNDNFIMLVGPSDLIKNSLKNILNIISDLILQVPSEVRQVDPKGVLTNFLRPMPGSARMYPETDIKTINLSQIYLDELKKDLPEIYSKKLLRLQDKYNLEQNKIEEILEYLTILDIEFIFENLNKNLSLIYKICFEVPKEIKKRENISTFFLSINLIKNIYIALNKNQLNKDLLYKLLIKIYTTKIIKIDDFEEFLNENNLKQILIDDKIIENYITKLIFENPKAPKGVLIGLVIKHFSGSISGKQVSLKLDKLLYKK